MSSRREEDEEMKEGGRREGGSPSSSFRYLTDRPTEEQHEFPAPRMPKGFFRIAEGPPRRRLPFPHRCLPYL